MFDSSNEGKNVVQKMAPEPLSLLPGPAKCPDRPPDPPTEGWWRDPLNSTEVYQRYHDGKRWTQYVRSRTTRSWTQIFHDRINTEVDPDALGIPRPPVVPDLPPEPPIAGWWEDPIEPRLKQAPYFDGAQWTEFIAPTKSAGPRLVTRRRDPKRSFQSRGPREARTYAAGRGLSGRMSERHPCTVFVRSAERSGAFASGQASNAPHLSRTAFFPDLNPFWLTHPTRLPRGGG
jgi:hypothetical protein